MHIDVKEGLAVTAGVAGLATSAIAAIRYFIQKEQLEGNLKRSEERNAELKASYNAVVDMIGKVKLSGTAALLLRSEVDTQLELATKALQATASSILVPLPGKNPSNLIFLSALGPASHQILRTTVPIDKGIAAHVFKSGKTYVASDVGSDREFFKGVDLLSSYTTVDLLCVPICVSGNTIGVLQFLNKESGVFTAQDATIAQRFADTLSTRVEQFVADPQNFELLGFAAADKTREGVVMFCDLTASSLLVDAMSFSSAISLMNEYLEKSCDIVIQHGGTVDKLLGDGAMFRFNVPREIPEARHQALRAAICMRDSFEIQKKAWIDRGLPARPIYNRIGLASGQLREAIMGGSQYQSLTVVGEPVVLSANLCAGAPRDRNVILTTQATLAGLDPHVTAKAVPQTVLRKIKGQQTTAYELLTCAPRTTGY
jgi:class 3 adenylate cyclase